LEISYDTAKNQRNIELRGLSFDRAAEFDLERALVLVDNRRDYGEVRYRAFGVLDDRMHVLVFTETARGIRVISLRRANKREVKRYGTQATVKPRAAGR
jgi:uncharacterized DUF497 family protein